jgi:hypothetical protein
MVWQPCVIFTNEFWWFGFGIYYTCLYTKLSKLISKILSKFINYNLQPNMIKLYFLIFPIIILTLPKNIKYYHYITNEKTSSAKKNKKHFLSKLLYYFYDPGIIFYDPVPISLFIIKYYYLWLENYLKILPLQRQNVVKKVRRTLRIRRKIKDAFMQPL